jgi:hypothetical protein
VPFNKNYDFERHTDQVLSVIKANSRDLDYEVSQAVSST